MLAGYDGFRRLADLEDELLDRDATPADRASVEIIKASAVCSIDMTLYRIATLLEKRGGGNW